MDQTSWNGLYEPSSIAILASSICTCWEVLCEVVGRLGLLVEMGVEGGDGAYPLECIDMASPDKLETAARVRKVED